ncbi:MAG: hypothetical protein AAGJ35_12455, partial [Myxococcota bacterium]
RPFTLPAQHTPRVHGFRRAGTTLRPVGKKSTYNYGIPTIYPSMNRKLFISIGATLFALFVLQDVLELRWTALQEWQAGQLYRRWSGLGLFTVILFQWTLSLVRVVPRWEEKSIVFHAIHNWLGAFSPLLFYVHSMQLGFAYLFLLSITFFGNFLLGMFNLDVLKSKSMLVYQGWMILHVAFSFFISFVTLYHIWVVFYYE